MSSVRTRRWQGDIIILVAAVSLIICAFNAPPSISALVSSSSSQPCRPLPSGFVHLRDVDASVLQEMRYATYHNFVGRPITSYLNPECILTIEAAKSLTAVQQFLMSGAADPAGAGQRYSLKVYDCYRPTDAVADFVEWAKQLNDTKMKAEFYPTLDKSDLFADGYIAYKSGHSKGSTMDLTLVPLPAQPEPAYKPGEVLHSCMAPVGTRWPDNSLDMGTGFDCFSTMAWTNDSTVTKEQHDHRYLLLDAMSNKGRFINYEQEWWHYTLENEPYPDTYFNFPVC